mmetsp:Transcript_26071/g.55869  ORF Transcript_26071/g.55869 Transcript_26071/m.55869 type:complete len:80 (+) Transcript_26071:349-588(+)
MPGVACGNRSRNQNEWRGPRRVGSELDMTTKTNLAAVMNRGLCPRVNERTVITKQQQLRKNRNPQYEQQHQQRNEEPCC